MKASPRAVRCLMHKAVGMREKEKRRRKASPWSRKVSDAYELAAPRRHASLLCFEMLADKHLLIDLTNAVPNAFRILRR